MSDTPDYQNGQPEPTKNDGPSIHDLMINDIKHGLMGVGRIIDTARGQMIDEIRERKRYGLNKYGTILQANNGRDAKKDAGEEIIDLLAYIRQGLEEDPKSGALRSAYVNAMACYRDLLAMELGMTGGGNLVRSRV